MASSPSGTRSLTAELGVFSRRETYAREDLSAPGNEACLLPVRPYDIHNGFSALR